MKIQQLLEEKRLLAVVYGGRFQPFHKGHYSVYRELCKRFGAGSVWIATSNKTNFGPSGDISPFNFDEKVELMTQLFKIPVDKIIKCKNPAFSPIEVLELYKAPTVCVMVAGDKDVERYESSESYQAYPTDEHGVPKSFNDVGSILKTATGEPAVYYYTISDARDGNQSGTMIRDAFRKAGDDADLQQKAFKRFYGKPNDEMLDLIVSKVGMIKDPKPKKEKKQPEEKPAKAEPKDEPLKEAYTKDEHKFYLELQQRLIDSFPDETEVELKHEKSELKVKLTFDGGAAVDVDFLLMKDPRTGANLLGENGVYRVQGAEGTRYPSRSFQTYDKMVELLTRDFITLITRDYRFSKS